MSDDQTDTSDDQSLLSRRNALKCVAYGGAGTLFAMAWHLGRGPARLRGGRLEGTVGEHPDRGLCPHAAVDDL
jgi:hypothetical protein